jgi:amino acid adenylation domain-containing protein/non-ribosomal peptide synthase protein (TIGR01720 family)
MQQETIQGYRLSPQQKRLWLLQQSENNPAYHARCAVEIAGEIDENILREALRHVSSQHEILRTTFQLLPGMSIPVQVIADGVEAALTSHDLTESNNPAGEIDRFFSDASNDRAFLLLHVDLAHLSSTRHVLIAGASALCADGPSLQYVMREIAEAYAALRRGDTPRTAESMQYADFAEWQNELLESEEAVAARRYWKQLDLPAASTQHLTFEQRPDSKTFQLASIPVDLSPTTAKRIEAYIENCSVSISAFLILCWQTLLWRLTRLDKIVTGVACDGRKFEELQNAIGLLTSYLPVESSLDVEHSFKELLRQVDEQLREAHRRQEYFSWTDDAIGFLPFCFELRRRLEAFTEDDLLFSLLRQDACTDRFKVKFVCEQSEDGLDAELQYDANLFAGGDMRRLAGELETLIESAGSKPEAAVVDLEILTEEERRLLLKEFNDTKKDFPTGRCIHELFETKAEQRPNAVAVTFEDDQITYAELNARANQLAHHLHKLGVGPEKTVGLCLERSVDLIAAMLGILKAGGAYVPLDPGLPTSRIAGMLADSGARALVTRTDLAKDLRDQVDQLVCLDSDRELLEREPTDNLQTGVNEQNLIYVIFTSGSTGSPKGVAVEHRQLANYVNAIWEKLALPDGSSFASVSTIAADLGNTALFPSLCNGGTLHLISEGRATNPDALADYCVRNAIDCLKIVPSHLQALLSAAHPAEILPRQRLVLGGEACSWRLIEKIKSLAPACEILNHYGPTEATVGATTNPIDGNDGLSEFVPLGRPLANTQVFILDERMRPVPVGTTGEIYVGGEGVARGYINRVASTAEKFVPNPFGEAGSRLYRTGDRARYFSDGRIEFLGRVDDQVKIHGYRIEPREIEIALRNHPQVATSAVVAKEDQSGAKRLVAYIVPQDHQAIDAGEIRPFLNGKLPEYMMPAAFVMLERLPLTPNGKLDHHALPEPDRARAKSAGIAAPRNEVESTLAGIWTSVLGIDRIGIDDNFFELGGDSILSIQIIARANRAGLKLSPRQLFQHQTIAELASVAGTSLTVKADQGVVIGEVPLTPVQKRFFEQNQPEPHHYNQAMLLEVNRSIDASLIECAFEQLLIHHDALRLRFSRNEYGWRQGIVRSDDERCFEFVDLSDLKEAERVASLQQHAARLQASLNLEAGPLLRVALFDRGAQGHCYLLVAIHHLAVDGVSWSILLEDLRTLCEQLTNAQPIALPAKTTSFKSWAERLMHYANSEALREEAPYWLSLSADADTRLPVDFQRGANVTASARTISVSLDANETRALLQDVPTAYRTQINEVLLTALARAVSSWTGSGSLLLDLEGHGREEIFDGVDLSRTVGWFTTIFPVVFKLKDAQTPIEALRLIKEQLRAIPNRGIGYGSLRYASQDADIAAALRAQPQAEIRFNYLGQLDRTLPESAFFKRATESSGPAQSPKGRRGYLLNVIGSVSNGQLRLEWTYSENTHRRETVERLAQLYVEELRALIANSRAATTASFSPTDFPQAKLSQEDLNKVLARVGAVEKK